jgi:tripartite-type tricarboxylate transporter receptor subunit TctC
VINRLNGEWLNIAVLPDTVEKMQNAMVELMTSTPEQFAALMKTEVARWGKVVKEANIKVE